MRHPLALVCLVLALSAPGQAARAASEAAEIRALMAKADLPAALQRAERAVAAKPQDTALRFLQGVVLMDLLRDAEALSLFTQLSQQYPELPDPLNNIALLHARGGRLTEARQALEAALRNDPSHRTARTNLGQIHLMLAVQAWEQAGTDGVPDAALQRKLDGARALLAVVPRQAR